MDNKIEAYINQLSAPNPAGQAEALRGLTLAVEKGVLRLSSLLDDSPDMRIVRKVAQSAIQAADTAVVEHAVSGFFRTLGRRPEGLALAMQGLGFVAAGASRTETAVAAIGTVAMLIRENPGFEGVGIFNTVLQNLRFGNRLAEAFNEKSGPDHPMSRALSRLQAVAKAHALARQGRMNLGYAPTVAAMPAVKPGPK